MRLLSIALYVCVAIRLNAATTTVVLGPGNSFNPSSITVNVGDTVHWDNSTGSGGFHNVAPNGGSEPVANSSNTGWTYDFTFNNPGAFPYFCQVHGGGMSGVVNVAATTPTPGTTPTVGTTPTPGSTGTPPIKIFDQAPELLLAPNPQKLGAPVCLYSGFVPDTSHWNVYNTALERVASLDFSGAALQCWDTDKAAPGLYYVDVKWVLTDGRVKHSKQKVVLWR